MIGQRTIPYGQKAVPPSTWFVGLDLGKSHDPTAVSILERRPVPQGKPNYFIQGLQRLELGTPYTEVVERVIALLNRPAAASGNVAPLRGCTLALDKTGVGAPVADLFAAARPPCKLVPILITSGARATHEAGEWHVPKRDLVSAVKLVFQEKRIHWDKKLPFSEHLCRELTDFEAKLTPAANEVYGVWREGEFDDLILSLALPLWLAERAASTPAGRPMAHGGMADVMGTLWRGSGGFRI